MKQIHVLTTKCKTATGKQKQTMEIVHGILLPIPWVMKKLSTFFFSFLTILNINLCAICNHHYIAHPWGGGCDFLSFGQERDVEKFCNDGGRGLKKLLFPKITTASPRLTCSLHNKCGLRNMPSL